MKVYYNSALLDSSEITISLDNRAFSYGDGFFETMVASGGKIRFFDAHWERLCQAAKTLQLVLPENFSKSYLSDKVKNLLKANDIDTTARIKVQVWRKTGGYFIPQNSQVEIMVSVSSTDLPKMNFSKRLGLAKNSNIFPSKLSKFKSCNSLPYILAGLEAKERELDDLIILNSSGQITECISSNIFWMKNDVFHTPSLASGCVAGIMRVHIIKCLQKNGSSVVESLTPIDPIFDADAIFTSNVTGLVKVSQLENHDFSTDYDFSWLEDV